MKKQLAIAIVAILLTTGLIASPVMAFALWDGNSVQYSSHWSEGYNSITDESVTASNQSIDIGNGIGERESSSRVKYYRAPVPVRTSNWPAIVMGTGIRECKSISKVYVDAVLNDSSTSMNEKPATSLDGPEGRVPGKITEGVIEGVPKGKIIKGTPENPEQVILYVKTADGKLHPLNVTMIRVLDGVIPVSDDPHP